MATLIDRVQALPRELYDEIYDHTFTKTSNIVHVDSEYRPPAALQVNHASRAKMAKSYYGDNSIFYVDRDVCSNWVPSLSEEHATMLNEVRISNKLIYTTRVLNLYQLWLTMGAEYNRLCDPSKGAVEVEAISQAIRLEVVYQDPGKTKWVSLWRLALESQPLAGPSSLLRARKWVEYCGIE